MISFRKKKKETEQQVSDKIILQENASFGAAEAYKIARTNIMFALAQEAGCRKIILTSALPAEGKTTGCINLAATFAQTNAKVLVIDGDLRRPRVHQYLGEKNREGLADYLAGFAEIADVIRYNEQLNFDYIPAGHIPPNPAELLASPKMGELLEELGSVYDYIFLDSPPVTVVADALVLAKFVSGVLVVAKQKQTPHDMLKKTIASLQFAEVKILGFLMNEAVQKHGVYRRGYKYGKKYGYGYGYGYGDEQQD